MSNIISQIFGLASTTAYVAGLNAGLGNISGMLQQIAMTFSGNASDGTYAYNLCSGTSGLSTTNGFNSSSPAWNNLIGLVNSYETLLPATIGISSLIYAFATYPNLLPEYQTYYINTYNTLIYDYWFNELTTPPVYFTNQIINNLLGSLQLSSLNEIIATSPSNTYSKMVNYNWYDTSPFFQISNSLAQLIKDIENQYYYLSGEILYDNLPNNLSPCINTTISIKTPTGIITDNYISNQPCYDVNSYIGPISGVKFLRIFNDGPPTSGYFDISTMNEYIALDEAVLSSNDYLSNNVNLYSYKTLNNSGYVYLFSGENIDIPGVFNPNAEYGIGETNFITNDQYCSWGNPPNYNGIPFMSMHEGDNFLKLYIDKHCIQFAGNNCIECGITSGFYNWTGWKLVNLELDQSLQTQFLLINTNPQSNLTRLLKRVLNIDPNSPYLNVQNTGDDVFTCMDYVGPPQLNGNSTLPGFVFYQTFDNQHFPSIGTFASVIIRPTISTSTQGIANSTSDRQFNSNISNFNILSGKSITHSSLGQNLVIPLKQTFNSVQMTGYDTIFKECLAIGDGFSGLVTFSQTVESNAGFIYTGYLFKFNGEPISLSQLLEDYNFNILGSKFSTVKYVTGYTKIPGPYKEYNYGSIEPQTAQILSGNSYPQTGQPITYYYFNTNPVTNVYNTGWRNNFAPIPSDVAINPTHYIKNYAYQTVENYLPRYSTGPFLTYNSTFLYPNANIIVQTYNSSSLGFPTGFIYVLNVREETVKEPYIVSGINKFIIPIQIIRAQNDNLFPLGTLMETPFVANNSIYKFTYDFNNNPSLYPLNGSFNYSAQLDSCVNANFVPNTLGCKQLNVNNSSMDGSFGLFNCGVRMTGTYESRVIYTGLSHQSTTIYNSEPLINGIYWGYKGYQRSGTIAYIPPIFDLSQQSFNVTEQMSGALFIVGNVTAYAFSNNGSLRYSNLTDINNNYVGKDPISYEYVGGRLGSTAAQQGGYNSQGIIGDAWYDFSCDTWGGNGIQFICGAGTYEYRYPERDSDFILLDFNTGRLNIHTRALQYSPYYLNWKYLPYNIPFLNIGIPIIPVQMGNEYYFNFNLRTMTSGFPLKTIINEGWYYPSGIVLGPFPLDSELCITGKDSIIPSGDLYINGELKATSNPSQLPQCVGTIGINSGFILNPIEDFTVGTGLILGQDLRSPILSTFMLIPSGGYVNINISGTGGKIGFTSDAKVTIRPRTVLGQTDPNSAGNFISGDITVMNEFNYLDNGSETIFSIPNYGKFENIIGKTFVFETAVKEEILYPLPASDFNTLLMENGVLTFDVFGNSIYDLSKGGPTYQYWKIKNPNGFFTGFREISRISFEIVSMIPQYGQIPYMQLPVLIPSGSCTISGAFGYSGEAESAVITKGIILSGQTFPSLMSGITQPLYVSDVLSRLSGIYVLPSGSGIFSVESAPSSMVTRLNYSIITGGDIYIPLTPTGTNYNSFLWPALSDFALFNPTLTYEQIPPFDGNIFPSNTLNFSASQGQQIISGVFNPIENVTYVVTNEWTFLDSISTNALYNTGQCLSTQLPTPTILNSGNLTGILAPEGASLTLALAI